MDVPQLERSAPQQREDRRGVEYSETRASGATRNRGVRGWLDRFDPDHNTGWNAAVHWWALIINVGIPVAGAGVGALFSAWETGMWAGLVVAVVLVVSATIESAARDIPRLREARRRGEPFRSREETFHARNRGRDNWARSRHLDGRREDQEGAT